MCATSQYSVSSVLCILQANAKPDNARCSKLSHFTLVSFVGMVGCLNGQFVWCHNNLCSMLLIRSCDTCWLVKSEDGDGN